MKAGATGTKLPVRRLRLKKKGDRKMNENLKQVLLEEVKKAPAWAFKDEEGTIETTPNWKGCAPMPPNKHGQFDINEMDDGRLLVQSPATNDKMASAPDGDPLIVNGAWYLEAYPSNIIIERADNSLGMINIMPFRAIKPQDIRDYKAYHPRKCKGHPLPEYLYRFYGLERNQESLSEVVRVRLSPTEKERLEAAAKNEGLTVSEFLRDQIREM